MKATELMILDLVKVENPKNLLPSEILDMLPRVGKVVGIDGDTVYLDFVDFGFMLDDVSPILLTTEILEKNGFKPQGTGWVLEEEITEDRIFSLCTISNAFCLLTSGMTLPFRYVHELQHLYRLAGMAREVKV